MRLGRRYKLPQLDLESLLAVDMDDTCFLHLLKQSYVTYPSCLSLLSRLTIMDVAAVYHWLSRLSVMTIMAISRHLSQLSILALQAVCRWLACLSLAIAAVFAACRGCPHDTTQPCLPHGHHHQAATTTILSTPARAFYHTTTSTVQPRPIHGYHSTITTTRSHERS